MNNHCHRYRHIFSIVLVKMRNCVDKKVVFYYVNTRVSADFFSFIGQRTNSLPSLRLPYSTPLLFEVAGPLNTARMSEERCKHPQWGLGRRGVWGGALADTRFGAY